LAGLYLHSVLIPAAGLYYNERGHEAYLKSDFANAERFHLASLEVVPDHPMFLDNLGMVYLQQFTDTRDARLLGLAREYFAKSIVAGPHSLDPYIHMETVLLQSLTGNPEQDNEIYIQLAGHDGRLLDIDPYLPFPRKNLASALYHLGQRERAIEELKKALEYEPNYVPGYLEISSWYRDLGEDSESNLFQNTAIKIVNKYRDYKPKLPYEGLLLGRPEESIAQK